MFERYTEKARRVIFFARYEASHYGSPEITPEHLLLGLIKEDKRVIQAALPDPAQIEAVQEEVRGRESARKPLPVSVDLPLSNPGKRVLAYAAEEAERRSDRHIGTEHFLMGLLRETSCDAAEILRKHGVKLDELRQGPRTEPSDVGQRYTAYGFARAARVEKDVHVEFIDCATQTPIAVSATPTAIPSLGEKILFEGSAKAFRVSDVAYVLEAEEGTAQTPWARLARILVTLELIESESDQSAF